MLFRSPWPLARTLGLDAAQHLGAHAYRNPHAARGLGQQQVDQHVGADGGALLEQLQLADRQQLVVAGLEELAHLTFQTETQARLLCSNLELHLFREFEQPGAIVQGEVAWHRFDIIASKPQGNDKYCTEQRSL